MLRFTIRPANCPPRIYYIDQLSAHKCVVNLSSVWLMDGLKNWKMGGQMNVIIRAHTPTKLAFIQNNGKPNCKSLKWPPFKIQYHKLDNNWNLECGDRLNIKEKHFTRFFNKNHKTGRGANGTQEESTCTLVHNSNRPKTNICLLVCFFLCGILLIWAFRFNSFEKCRFSAHAAHT